MHHFKNQINFGLGNPPPQDGRMRFHRHILPKMRISKLIKPEIWNFSVHLLHGVSIFSKIRNLEFGWKNCSRLIAIIEGDFWDLHAWEMGHILKINYLNIVPQIRKFRITMTARFVTSLIGQVVQIHNIEMWRNMPPLPFRILESSAQPK